MKKYKGSYTVLFLSLLIGVVLGNVVKDLALGILIGILTYPLFSVMKRY